MIRAILIPVVALVVIPFNSYAQVPGDINCSGSFNGLDITYLVNYLSHWVGAAPFMDTTTCAWENGDMKPHYCRLVADIFWQSSCWQ
jgi:hypothetical protein